MSARYAKSYVCGGIDFPDDADDLNKKTIFQRSQASRRGSDQAAWNARREIQSIMQASIERMGSGDHSIRKRDKPS